MYVGSEGKEENRAFPPSSKTGNLFETRLAHHCVRLLSRILPLVKCHVIYTVMSVTLLLAN